MNAIVKQHQVNQAPQVSLSPTAVDYVKARLGKSPKAIGVFLHVNNAGCSGMSYIFDIVEKKPENALLFLQTDDIQLFVDPSCLPYVNGTIIDYITEGLNKKITFRNPNAKNTCGCGESFNPH